MSPPTDRYAGGTPPRGNVTDGANGAVRCRTEPDRVHACRRTCLSASSAALKRRPGRGSARRARRGTRWSRQSSAVRVRRARSRPHHGRVRGRRHPPIASVSSAEARPHGTDRRVDRVLGGGLVPGSIVLFGGDPGIGKCTLLLQLAARLARPAAREVLYVTGEESVSRSRPRGARRRRGRRPGLVATTELATAVGAIDRRRPALAVVDSVQTWRRRT